MTAFIRRKLVYHDTKFLWILAQLESVSLVRSVVKAGLNLTELLTYLTTNSNYTFAEKLWSDLLDQLSTPQIMEGCGVLAPNPRIFKIILNTPCVFEALPKQNIVTIALECIQANALLDSPYFDPANLVKYLLNSPLYVKWSGGIEWLITHPKVKPHLTKHDFALLIQHSRKLRRHKITSFLEQFEVTLE